MTSFEYHRRAAPKVPSETCPEIDAAISQIDDIAGHLSALADRHGALEKLRSANGELRDLALYWRQAAEELASQVDDLGDRVAELERELDSALSERVAA